MRGWLPLAVFAGLGVILYARRSSASVATAADRAAEAADRATRAAGKAWDHASAVATTAAAWTADADEATAALEAAAAEANASAEEAAASVAALVESAQKGATDAVTGAELASEAAALARETAGNAIAQLEEAHAEALAELAAMQASVAETQAAAIAALEGALGVVRDQDGNWYVPTVAQALAGEPPTLPPGVVPAQPPSSDAAPVAPSSPPSSDAAPVAPSSPSSPAPMADDDVTDLWAWTRERAPEVAYKTLGCAILDLAGKDTPDLRGWAWDYVEEPPSSRLFDVLTDVSVETARAEPILGAALVAHVAGMYPAAGAATWDDVDLTLAAMGDPWAYALTVAALGRAGALPSYESTTPDEEIKPCGTWELPGGSYGGSGGWS